MGQISLTGQALALHNLGTNGLITRTAAGTVAGRTISSGTGVTVTNGDGVAGNPSIALAGQALALNNITDNGLIYRTGASTFAAATYGYTPFLRDYLIIPGAKNSINLLNTQGLPLSTQALGIVPADFNFFITQTLFIVDTVTFTGLGPRSGDTMPLFRIYNSATLTNVANTLSPQFTPFTYGGNFSQANQYAWVNTSWNRAIAASSGSTIYVRTEEIYRAADTGNAYTALSGRIALRGFLSA
jgi:hypothetical protein